jgi:hypothetical protein
MFHILTDAGLMNLPQRAEPSMFDELLDFPVK